MMDFSSELTHQMFLPRPDIQFLQSGGELVSEPLDEPLHPDPVALHPLVAPADHRSSGSVQHSVRRGKTGRADGGPEPDLSVKSQDGEIIN